MIISFFFSLLLGALAGYVAGRLMGSRTSALRNVVLGILDSIGGTFLFNLIGLWCTGTIGSFIAAVVGACVCIWLERKISH